MRDGLKESAILAVVLTLLSAIGMALYARFARARRIYGITNTEYRTASRIVNELRRGVYEQDDAKIVKVVEILRSESGDWRPQSQ